MSDPVKQMEENRSCWGCARSQVIEHDLYCMKSGKGQLIRKEQPCDDHKDMWEAAV